MDNKDIRKKLEETLRECSRLRQENERLRKLLNLTHDNPLTQETSLTHGCPVSTVTNDSPAEMKVALFRQLFKGREDIYPLRWETKHGKAGYSPACRHEWNRAYCDKPRIKCGQCDNRDFLPVTDKVIYDHLAAYSGASRTLIPFEVGPPFRFNPDPKSSGSRTLIPLNPDPLKK